MFPLYSPNFKFEVVRRGVVRRAKVYYLRGRVCRAARIAERNDYVKDNRVTSTPSVDASSQSDSLEAN